MILTMIFSVSVAYATADRETTNDTTTDSNGIGLENQETGMENDTVHPMLVNARNETAERAEKRVMKAHSTLANKRVVNRSTLANERATNVRNRIMDRYQNLNADTQARLKTMYQQITPDQKRALAKASPELVQGIMDYGNTKKLLELPTAALGRVNVSRLNNEDYRKKLVNRVEEGSKLQENNFKYRVVAKDAMERARQRYEDARDNFEKITEQVQEARAEFSKIKDQVLVCKENPNAENCTKVTEISKRYIQRTIDYVKGSMTKLAAKVESSEELSENAVTERLAEINGTVADLDALEERLVNAETFEDVRAIGQEVNQVSTRARNGLKVAAGSIANNKMRSVIAQANSLQKRLDIMVSNLDKAGVDTSSLDEQIVKFNAKIEDALALSEEIDTNYAAIKSGQNVSELAQTVNGQMKDARSLLNEAQDILKDIFSSVRDLRKEANLTEEELEDDEYEDDSNADDVVDSVGETNATA